MVPIPMFDVLEIIPSDVFSFTSSGLAISGTEESNLCVRAFRLVEERYGITSVRIHLIKQIPMGAGLGGGSSDGAFVLKGLNDLFQLDLDNDELRTLAEELGSDCPFFIESKPQIATGRGEVLELVDLDLTGLYLKIVNPQIHVSTADAYANVKFSEQSGFEDELKKAPIDWKEVIHNGFEDSIFPDHPIIADIKNEMYAEGAIYSSMSGSGSTVYGLFTEKPEADSSFYCKVMRL